MGGGRQADGEPDIAFIQLGQKFAAQLGSHRQAGDQEPQGSGQNGLTPPFRPGHDPAVKVLKFAHPGQMLFRQIVLLQVEGGQGRGQGEGQKNGPQNGKRQGVGHGGENLPFHPLEGKDGQESQNDDGLREENGMAHFHRGVLQGQHAPLQGAVGRPPFLLRRGQTHHQGLHQHHRPVDDDAEVHRPQGDKIGRHPLDVHHDESGEQGQGNDQGHHGSSKPGAQENDQNTDHQTSTHHQVFAHRVHRVINQLGPVIDGHQLHPRGQLVSQTIQFGLDPRHHGGGILALGHLHHPLNHVVPFIEGDDAGTGVGTDGHIGHIGNQHGLAVIHRHRDPANVVQAVEEANGAHHQGFVPPVDDAAPRVGIAVGQGLGKLINADPKFA